MRPYRTIKTRNNPLAVSFLSRWPEIGIRSSNDGKTFGPPPLIRLFYWGLLFASLLAIAYFALLLWKSNESTTLANLSALAGALVISVLCIVTWPPTVVATPEGLQWHRLIIHRFIPWDQIEAAYFGFAESLMSEEDGYGLGLYIFLKGGKRYGLNDFVMGRAQLKALIKEKRGSAAIVR